jgi:hypothetical protein
LPGIVPYVCRNGLGLELINGSGCDVRGDLMCDTKADPYSFFSDDCFSIDTTDNTYNGIAGIPMVTNFMILPITI